MGKTLRSHTGRGGIHLNTMTIEETRQIIPYFTDKQGFLSHRHNRQLSINGNGYQIRPDDAFYYHNKVLLFEYENTKRPVESISKYFWLLKRDEWLGQNIRIKLLLTINNERTNEIRTQTIQILGELLNQQYPNSFDFHFLDYGELTEENLLAELEKISMLIFAEFKM